MAPRSARHCDCSDCDALQLQPNAPSLLSVPTKRLKWLGNASRVRLIERNGASRCGLFLVSGGGLAVRCRRHRSSPPMPCLHFIGFHGEEYWSAVRIFGRPDFFHRYWDYRAIGNIAPGDTVAFAAACGRTGCLAPPGPRSCCSPREPRPRPSRSRAGADGRPCSSGAYRPGERRVWAAPGSSTRATVDQVLCYVVGLIQRKATLAFPAGVFFDPPGLHSAGEAVGILLDFKSAMHRLAALAIDHD